MICPICLENDERIINEGDECPECLEYFENKEALNNYYIDKECEE